MFVAVGGDGGVGAGADGGADAGGYEDAAVGSGVGVDATAPG